MLLAVGLGNPGEKYRDTRHNLGFQVVDKVAEFYALRDWKEKFESHFTQGAAGEKKFLLVKPQTFMNLSGRAVQALMRFYKTPLDQLIVITDDLDLEVGRIRLREKGSDGGHRGLRSIIECVGSNEFKRVRIGIGRPPAGQSVLARVLKGSSSREEQEKMDEAIEQAARLIVDFIEKDQFENWSSS